MAGRILELAISIKGKLDKVYTDSMHKAIAEAGNLQRKLKEMSQAAQGSQKLMERMGELKGIQANILRFRELKQTVTAYGTQLTQAQANASRYAAELRRSQAATEALRQKHDALSASLKSLKGKIPAAEWRQMNAEAKTLKAALKESEASTKAVGRAFEQAKNHAASLKSKLAEQQAELQRVRAAMSSAGYGTQNLTQNEIRLRQEIEQTTRAMARAAQEQERVNARRAAQDNSHRAQQDMYNAAGNFQNAIGNAQTVMRPFAGAIENAMDFEHSLSKVKALTQSGLIREGKFDEVNANMQKLEAQARELGATTQFTMTQAADAMGYLGMAGWKTEQIYGTMPGMLDLAAGSGVDLARTADIVSDNMTAMGVPVEQAGHFMDVYAYALTNANVNLESLGETMKYAAPVAAAFGARLEDTAAMTMMMGNAGIKGSMAGTALRMGLLRLSGPPKKASKEMEALGISVSDATAMAMEAQAEMQRLGIHIDENASPMDKMSNIIKQLQVKMQGLSREEKLASIGAIFGANAASGWINIIEQGGDVFDQYRDALRNSDGYAKQFAHTMNDDTRGALIALDSATDAVINSLGTVFLPLVRQAAEWLAPMATGLATWISQNKGVAMAIGALAAALSVAMIAAAGVQMVFAGWAFIASTIDLVTTSQTLLAAKTKLSAIATMIHAGANAALGASMNALSSPVTRATALFDMFSKKVSVARTAATGLPDKISKAFKAIPSVASKALTALPAMVSGVFSSLVSMIGSAFVGLATVGLPVIAAIAAIIAVIAILAANWNNIKDTAEIVWNHIAGTISAQVERIKAAFGSALERITATWNSVTGGTATSADWILGVINNVGFAIGVAFDIAAGVVGTSISVILNLVASVAQIIGGVVNIIVGIFTGDWKRAWKGAGQAVEGFAGGTLGTIKTIADGIGDIFDTLMGKSAEVQRQAEQAQAQQDLIAKSRSANVTADYMPDEGMMQTAQAAQQTAQATAEASAHAQELSANVEQSGAAAQQTTDYMQQLQTVMGQVPAQAQTAFSGMGEQSAAAAQAVNTSMQQIPTQTQATFQQLPPMAQQGTDAMVQEFSQLATKCQPGGEAFVQAANQWGQQAYQAIANWSDQMAHAVVDKLSNAWAQISAQFSAGLNVNVTTSGAGVAANPEGGIYKKGAFLTTFAEKSPEAAIPLDGSDRAISLWQKAGEMLGMMPKGTSEAASFDIPNLPDFTHIAADLPDMRGLPITNQPMSANERAASPVMDFLSKGIGKLSSAGGEIVKSLLPMKQGINLPPIMNMMEALPPEISTIAEVVSPPTEAQMAAAPIAYEPPSAGGEVSISFNPQITIQGNADSGTVSQMGDMLSKLKAELMREVRRELGGMMADHQRNQRRLSYAT